MWFICLWVKIFLRILFTPGGIPVHHLYVISWACSDMFLVAILIFKLVIHDSEWNTSRKYICYLFFWRNGFNLLMYSNMSNHQVPSSPCMGCPVKFPVLHVRHCFRSSSHVLFSATGLHPQFLTVLASIFALAKIWPNVLS